MTKIHHLVLKKLKIGNKLEKKNLIEYLVKITNELSFIRTALEEISGLPVDLTVLSIEEEKDTEFLKRIYPIFLKLK